MALRHVLSAAPWYPQNYGMHSQEHPPQQPLDFIQGHPTFGDSYLIHAGRRPEIHFFSPQNQEQDNHPKNSMGDLLPALRVVPHRSEAETMDPPSIPKIAKTSIRKAPRDNTKIKTLLRNKIDDITVEIAETDLKLTRKRNCISQKKKRMLENAITKGYNQLISMINNTCTKVLNSAERLKLEILQFEEERERERESSQMLYLQRCLELEKKKADHYKKCIEDLVKDVATMNKNEIVEKVDEKVEEAEKMVKTEREDKIKTLLNKKKKQQAEKKRLEQQIVDDDEDDDEGDDETANEAENLRFSSPLSPF